MLPSVVRWRSRWRKSKGQNHRGQDTDFVFSWHKSLYSFFHLPPLCQCRHLHSSMLSSIIVQVWLTQSIVVFIQLRISNIYHVTQFLVKKSLCSKSWVYTFIFFCVHTSSFQLNYKRFSSIELVSILEISKTSLNKQFYLFFKWVWTSSKIEQKVKAEVNI